MNNGGRIVQVFQDADMRCSHDGLRKLATKAKLDLNALSPGDYVVFFNTRRTHLKIFAAFNTIAYRRCEKGRFFDLSCITEVVRAFHNTGRIEYDKALKARIEELLKVKQ